MTSFELYEKVAVAFPPLSPIDPCWEWVNVHDGERTKLDVLTRLIDRLFGAGEVVVAVHSEPGAAFQMTTEHAVGLISDNILEYDIQVADLGFTRFFSMNRSGVATGDAR